jgi:hypothetical protein
MNGRRTFVTVAATAARVVYNNDKNIRNGIELLWVDSGSGGFRTVTIEDPRYSIDIKKTCREICAT